MKKGDLVEFCSKFFGREYNNKNPGLVLEVIKGLAPYDPDKKSASVLWCDGTTTTEHASLLKTID